MAAAMDSKQGSRATVVDEPSSTVTVLRPLVLRSHAALVIRQGWKLGQVCLPCVGTAEYLVPKL